jgi:hypothetical protein
VRSVPTTVGDDRGGRNAPHGHQKRRHKRAASDPREVLTRKPTSRPNRAGDLSRSVKRLDPWSRHRVAGRPRVTVDPLGYA